MAINSFDSAPGVPLIQLQWNLSKGVMRRHLTRSHTYPRRHVGCFCNASKDLKSEKATCKLILHQISRHLIHAFKLLPLGNEFFIYHFNTLGRLYWMWSLRAARMCSVDVCKTSWPHLRKSARSPDGWVSGDRFFFPALDAFLPSEITVVSVCQLELSLSLLLRASYSQTVPPGWREGGGEKERGLFLLDTMDEQSVSTPWCSWRVSKEKRRKPRLSITSEEPTVQLTDKPPWAGLVQSAEFSWQADRASWKTSHNWTDQGSGHRAAVYAPQPGWHWTCWLVEFSVSEWVSEGVKQQWECRRCLRASVGFYEHVIVIEI